MVIEKDIILIYSLKIAFGSVRYGVMNKTSGLKVSDAAPSQPVTFKTESFFHSSFLLQLCHSAAALLTSYSAHEYLCVNLSSCPNPRAPSPLSVLEDSEQDV